MRWWDRWINGADGGISGERERSDGETGGWVGGYKVNTRNLFSHSVGITMIV